MAPDGLLPELQEYAAFAPVAGFLTGGDPARRLQLAQRQADLFDQYQVYRSDWLNDWASGHDLLRSASGATTIVPADQVWQPALWRALLDTLDVEQIATARPQLHERFIKALSSPTAPAVPGRIVLFGHHARATADAGSGRCAGPP